MPRVYADFDAQSRKRKVTIFVTDIAVIDNVIELRREFFTPPYPADTIARVASLTRPERQIEIDAVAVVPGPV